MALRRSASNFKGVPELAKKTAVALRSFEAVSLLGRLRGITNVRSYPLVASLVYRGISLFVRKPFRGSYKFARGFYRGWTKSCTKKSWIGDSPVNANQQWFPMLSKWCEWISSIHNRVCFRSFGTWTAPSCLGWDLWRQKRAPPTRDVGEAELPGFRRGMPMAFAS